MKSGDPAVGLGDALRSAYGPGTGCPPPEVFLELPDLPAEERRRIEEHADRCPACAAERDLARLFTAPPAERAVRQEDVDYVVSHLQDRAWEGSAVPAPAPARVLPFRRRSWLAPLAAAAVLVLAVALVLQMRTGPPALPDPEAGTAVRGSQVSGLAPAGELEDMPAELRWEELEEARAYRVTLRGVDGSVLWESKVSGSPAPLPAELVERLHPAVLYRWSVEALDERGEPLARSEPLEFRVRPR